MMAPTIPLIDYLDEKVEKWWEKPEVVNALVTDRTYHLTHLEMFRTGTLSVTKKTANTALIEYNTGHTVTVFNYFREKMDIELKYPEMPLFTCDDGEATMYPAEVISLEIARSETIPTETQFVGHSCKCQPLVEYLENKIGEDWIQKPETVETHLKSINFHLELFGPPAFGSLTLSKKTPKSAMEFPIGTFPFTEWFSKMHHYNIKDISTPLVTVNRMDMKKFHWPAELISVVLN